MCEGCYAELGRPTIINEKTRAALSLIHKVYEFSWDGGCLHVVLDDWNLDDDNLVHCSKVIADGGDFPDYPQKQLAIERECCDLLMTMTIEERASALAIEHGYFSPEVTV